MSPAKIHSEKLHARFSCIQMSLVLSINHFGMGLPGSGLLFMFRSFLGLPPEFKYVDVTYSALIMPCIPQSVLILLDHV